MSEEGKTGGGMEEGGGGRGKRGKEGVGGGKEGEKSPLVSGFLVSLLTS